MRAANYANLSAKMAFCSPANEAIEANGRPAHALVSILSQPAQPWIHHEHFQTEIHHLRLLWHSDSLPDGGHGPRGFPGSDCAPTHGVVRAGFCGVSTGRSAGRLEALRR